MDRRHFLKATAAVGTATAARLYGQPTTSPAANVALEDLFPANGVSVPDEGWKLWLDEKATWKDDELHLPGTFKLTSLANNPPTGGWGMLDQAVPGPASASVILPTTVEQHFWDRFLRSYTPEEYRYAADDPAPQNGAYLGVSWWWRELEIPTSMHGQRILLQVRGARMRAEVYLNNQLVGYSIMEELPFECDLTRAAKPGANNRLAIRITNPGGRYDWMDYTLTEWGKVNVYRSHGFGGLDRGIVLQAVPHSGRIVDAWALNTPNARTIIAHAKLEGGASNAMFEIIEPFSGVVLAKADGAPVDSTNKLVRTAIPCPGAKLWDLTTPVLYRLRVTAKSQGQTDVRTVAFGFRWYAPNGLGTNALFRLNGRRIKIYTAISWGYWGFNGMWPTPELAEREVTQAQKLGLNCLNFHRNVGKEEVFRQHDRLGLLRDMEPGGGTLSIPRPPKGSVKNEHPSEADLFSSQFMLEKCRAMVRAFRSHPSLIQYTLQNEIVARLENPDTFAALKIMHEEDPSRCVVLCDGFTSAPEKAPQVWYAPYNNTMYRSDKEEWGGWWNKHQGGGGDQWYDHAYQDSTTFNYYEPIKTSLVEFGEMQGCAVADNHPLMIHQIESGQFGGSGKSYDLKDHKEITAGCEKFLERWGFRTGFPTSETLYRSLGQRCYESWQQYMENIRICDEVDFAAISGWESTAVDNHSGIVDNLRNFKGDPQLIGSSLLPVRPLAKQHSMCCALGEAATFDLYLLNDTGKAVDGKLRLSMVDPGGTLTELGAWPVPANVADQFTYPIEISYKTPPLQLEGIYRFKFVCDSLPLNAFTREIWVANTQLRFGRKIKVALSNVVPAVRQQLTTLQDVEVSEFSAGQSYDLIVSSGVGKGPATSDKAAELTGVEAPPSKATIAKGQGTGRLTDQVLAALKVGTPLLAMLADDSLADGVAMQMAAEGAFTYDGLVGRSRASWMGSWLFMREHATFHSLPVNRAMSVHYQPNGSSNGLLIERAPGAEDPQVIMGYSRDHDRRVGAASFHTRLGKGSVLFHRAPPFSAPLQQRWLINSVAFLTGTKPS